MIARSSPWARFFIATLGFAAAGSPASAADAKPERIQFEFALYFAPKPSTDPDKEMERLLKEPERRLALAKEAGSRDVVATIETRWLPLADYAPPSVESLRYMSAGVPESEAPALAAADRVYVVSFSTARLGVLFANREACLLLADLADATDGRVWDEETRLLYTRERWRTDRTKTWQGSLPDMMRHVNMHAYADPELIRIITLGMRKFGLSDLVITEIPSQHTRPMGNFINAFAQRLVEGQRPEQMKMKLTLGEIRSEAARRRALENPGDGAKGSVLVSVRVVPREEGDPNNTLWLLDFPDAKLKSATERAMWGGSELFGSTDHMVGVKSGDEAMAAARDRARENFFAQETRFRKGLAFKEHLVVKAPFSEDDQKEYMWVEVVSWGPKSVEGILNNDPYYVKRLHAGARVTVAFDDIYDYIFYKADGTEEGNETGKVLEQLEKKR